MDGIAREQAIYQALKAAAEVAAALQARLIEEHNADPERAATQSTFTTSLKLLRQARERFGEGLRAAGGPATSPSLTRSACATGDQQAPLVTCQSAARRPATVAGRPGRAGRGPEPWRPRPSSRRSTPGFAGAAARPAEVPKFRYRPLSEVRLREALLIREFRVVYL